MRWMICLVLAGCATPMDDLYRQLSHCLANGDICEDLQAEIERRNIMIDQRDYDRAKRCPEGYVEYCDNTMRGCGRTHKSQSDEYVCITPSDLRDLFRMR